MTFVKLLSIKTFFFNFIKTSELVSISRVRLQKVKHAETNKNQYGRGMCVFGNYRLYLSILSPGFFTQSQGIDLSCDGAHQ